MTAQPLLKGRKLPPNDWEGDDFTPGAGGHYVTCQDTAAGRDVCFATNGRVNKDGRVYRAALPGNPSGGITLRQADIAIFRIAALRLTIPTRWEWKDVQLWLSAGGGLIIDGWYDAIPRAYRYQLDAAFAHAMFVSHISKTSGARTWDALNPDTTGYGRWYPPIVIRKFLETLAEREGAPGLFVGYVPLLKV